MHTAKEISIGGRRQVLEDGKDVCDSENEEHREALTGMYKNVPLDDKRIPLSSAYKLTAEQANDMRMGGR
jgi:hypothetical protein